MIGEDPSIDSVTGVAICNEEQPTVVAAGCGGKKC